MSQGSDVSAILDRITQESSQITLPSKPGAIRVRRPAKSTPSRARIIVSVPMMPSSSEGNLSEFNAQWDPVEVCLDAIFSERDPPSFEGPFHAIEKLCRDPENFPRMEARLNSMLDAFGASAKDRLRGPLSLEEIVRFLGFLEHIKALLSCVLSPFEQRYLSRTGMAVAKAVVDRLRIAIYQNPDEAARIATEMCAPIVRRVDELREAWIERDDLSAEVPAEFGPLSEFLMVLGMMDTLNAALLQATERFYSFLNFDTSLPSMFLECVKRVLEKEEIIIGTFPQVTRGAVIAEVKRSLYVHSLHREMGPFLASLMAAREYDSLRSLSLLVFASGDPELEDNMIRMWGITISAQVHAAFEQEDTPTVIEDLLQMHSSIFTCASFLGAGRSQQLMRCFRQALNTQSSRSAFMLAEYCHIQLLVEPHDFMSDCDQVLRLFRALDSMDLFAQHHRQFLALRLFQSPARSDALRCESDFLRRMGAICGDQEVSCMDRMIEDSEASSEVEEEFPSGGDPPMSFLLCSYNSWPAFPRMDLLIPADVIDAKERFTQYYKVTQPGRKLVWQTALDNVSFRVHNCRLHGSVLYFVYLQTIIVGGTFEEAGLTSSDTNNLAEVLVNVGVLQKSGDQFTLASVLPNKTIPMLPIPLSISPNMLAEHTMEEVAFSKRMKVEAAIVLVMKRLKIADPAELFLEAAVLVHFPMTQDDFDSGVKSCLDKCYLHRTPDDRLAFSD
jgi:hypothetical protein